MRIVQQKNQVSKDLQAVRSYNLNLVKFSKEKAECIRTQRPLLGVIYWRINLNKAKQKVMQSNAKLCSPLVIFQYKLEMNPAT